MADCVHAACEPYIVCRRAPAPIGFRDVARCDYCGKPVVFVPQDLLWIRMAGYIKNKVECSRSPGNRHGVRQ